MNEWAGIPQVQTSRPPLTNGIANPISIDPKHSLRFRQTRRVIYLANTGVASSLSQIQSGILVIIVWYRATTQVESKTKQYLVVDA